MAGSAVNRGGIRVEFSPDVDDANFAWWVRMRNHAGHGPTPEDAYAHLIGEIERELTVVKASAATLRKSRAVSP